MATASFDVAVIGAGAVGLACAAELARDARDVVVLERHGRSAAETSSRNSEVIHAGIYYPPASLKARSCVEGRELVYARCQKHAVPHRRIGKLIVATSEDEVTKLAEIRERAEAAGAGALDWLDTAQLGGLEPRVRARAALWSPMTGIVDAHALVDSYQAELEAAGGTVVFHTTVLGLERRASSWRLETAGPQGDRFDLEVGVVVNAAGLDSARIAVLAGVDVDEAGWRIHLCKGDYFGLEPSRGPLTAHLVYPVPTREGLGVHVTLDLAGRTRFGPDAEYVDEVSYEVDASKAGRFAAAVQRYLPEVRSIDLFPEMAGVRPKLQGPGEAFRDFVVEESPRTPGMLHLVGIESPGLTASEALARRVVRMLHGQRIT